MMTAYSDGIFLPVDTIMNEVIDYAPFHKELVEDYRAEIYMKSKIYVRKRNGLIRYLPAIFRLKKGVKDYIIESYGELHYTAPNIYDQKIKAFSGTVDRFRTGNNLLTDYFQVNVYSASLLRAKLVSPLSASAPKYYSYKLDSVISYKGEKAYCISFKPHTNSYQLVMGHMIVSDKLWTVRFVQFSGRSEYMYFDNKVQMGDVGSPEEFLPVSVDLNIRFDFLGNKVDANYQALFDYTSITLKKSVFLTDKPPKINYDLTESYRLQCDTTSFSLDTAYFASLRPVPLSSEEKKIYQGYYHQTDSLPVIESPKTPNRVFWGQIGDVLISNYNIDLAEVGTVRASPLINPLLISYSGSRGFSYRQEFKYNRLLPGDRLLRVVPKFGYNFTHKEFYFTLNSDYYYWPRKRASFHLSMGNGNRIYSSDVLEDLKQMPDSVFDFDKMNLNYFRDFFLDLKHSVEIWNGFILDVGITIHRRTAIGKSEFVPLNSQNYFSMPPLLGGIPGASPGDPEAPQKIRRVYVSFAPRVRVTWSPGQYYYMRGTRKVNLHSRYPTFSIDWERGIPGVLQSTGKYERIEFDMQHQLSLGLMRSLYYRFGGGAFIDQKQLYFVDFANFSRNNLPSGWNDDIGGVFQILDGRWYNSSRKYLRANLTYESPFLLLPRLIKFTRNVLNERLYGGMLIMPHLNPYIELGYGIGTHIFDLGVFVSNTNGKFDEVGFKFTFELFNR